MGINKLTTEGEYFADWYDWELIHENYKQEIKPEEIVAVNKGFGTSKGLTAIAGQVTWVTEKKIYQLSSIKIRKSRRISFYNNGYGFYEITDLFASPNKSQKALMPDITNLYLNSNIFILDNSNKPIYQVNEISGLSLDNEYNIKNYIHFFFNNVSGRHGRFYPCEDINEINHLICFGKGDTEFKDYCKDYIKEIQERFGEFPDLKIKDEQIDLMNDTIQIKGVYIIFKGSLFSCNIDISKKDGFISLSEEVLIIEFN